ncbi:sarcosine oxidase subunit beta, partial [Enterobacter hormaechei]|nr:sarcosine oxidase subunit beta [Enterobacter hormaechei]
MKLWETMSHDLNYNVMFSQRGVVNLAHNLPQLDVYVRRGNQMRLNGIDCELMNPKQLEKLIPGLDTSASARFPIIGGLMQRSA